MTIYLVCVLLFFLGSFFTRSLFSKSKTRKVETIFCCVILLLVACLRSENVGSDTLHYIDYLPYIKSLSWHSFFEFAKQSDQEIGYLFLTKLTLFVSVDSHFFIIWTSALGIIPVSLFIYKYSKFPCVSFSIYVLSSQFLFALGIVRHTIALSFLLLFVHVIFQRKKHWLIFASLSAVAAFLFHKSSAIVVLATLFYFLFKKKLFIGYIVGFSLVIVSFLFKNPLLHFVSLLRGADNVDQYLQESSIGVGRIIIPLAIFLVSFLYRSKATAVDSNFLFFECFAFFSFLLSIVSLYLTALVRASNLLNIAYLILIPDILAIKHNKSESVLMVSAIIISYIFVFIFFFDNQYLYYFWK